MDYEFRSIVEKLAILEGRIDPTNQPPLSEAKQKKPALFNNLKKEEKTEEDFTPMVGGVEFAEEKSDDVLSQVKASLADYLKSAEESVKQDKDLLDKKKQDLDLKKKELKDLVSDYLRPFLNNIESVAGPANDQAADILNTGAIIRKTNNGYTHKVILRDGRYGSDIKEAILSYLNGLNVEIVNVPKSCREMFCKSSGFVWNCYFYTNDASVVTFLNLIHPGLVSNIHELVVAH